MPRLSISVATLCLAASAPLSAQQAPPRPAPAGMPHENGPDRMQQHGDDLALLLALRPEQRAALDTYLKATQPSGGPPPHGLTADATPPQPGMRPAPPPPTAGNFEQQLATMQKRATDRSADEQRRISALKNFYESLDAQQQRRFEAVLRLSHGVPGPGSGFGPPPGPGHAGAGRKG